MSPNDLPLFPQLVSAYYPHSPRTSFPFSSSSPSFSSKFLLKFTPNFSPNFSLNFSSNPPSSSSSSSPCRYLPPHIVLQRSAANLQLFHPTKLLSHFSSVFLPPPDPLPDALILALAIACILLPNVLSFFEATRWRYYWGQLSPGTTDKPQRRAGERERVQAPAFLVSGFSDRFEAWFLGPEAAGRLVGGSSGPLGSSQASGGWLAEGRGGGGQNGRGSPSYEGTTRLLPHYPHKPLSHKPLPPMTRQAAQPSAIPYCKSLSHSKPCLFYIFEVWDPTQRGVLMTSITTSFGSIIKCKIFLFLIPIRTPCPRFRIWGKVSDVWAFFIWPQCARTSAM